MNSTWSLLIAAVVLIAAAFARRGNLWRIAWSTLAAVLIAIAAANAVKVVRNPVTRDVYTPVHFGDPLPYGGYRLLPNQVTRHQGFVNERQIFDIHMTANADGLRISPAPGAAERSIVFLGCSYTFGHGVQDNETFAYLTGVRLRDRYAAYNFGHNGDGAHHMLSAIRAGAVEQLVKQPPKLFVFTALRDHVRRAVGWQVESYRMHDPMYRLGADGDPVLAGRFSDRSEQELSQLRDSQSMNRFFQPRQTDLDLYTAIVRKSRDELMRRYPDAVFEVLYWPDASETSSFEDLLRRAGLSVHSARQFLPGKFSQYQVDPADVHPNALAHRLAADFITSKLVPPVIQTPANGPRENGTR